MRSLRHVRIGLLVSALALIVIAVPLTVHTVDVIRDQRFERKVSEAVRVWDPNATIVELDADVADRNRASVDLTIATTSFKASPAWQLADALSRDTGMEVDLAVRIRLEEQDAATAG